MRARLWWLLIAGFALILIALPRLGAVDADDQLKLAVVFTTTLTAFLAVMLSILFSGSILRRDREAKLLATLWSKPLPRFAYLLGRCLWGVGIGGSDDPPAWYGCRGCHSLAIGCSANHSY